MGLFWLHVKMASTQGRWGGKDVCQQWSVSWLVLLVASGASTAGQDGQESTRATMGATRPTRPGRPK